MSCDFEKIAADLRMHFCPLCKASFGCEHEEGECDCIGQEYADDWRKPWCPHCYDLKKQEAICNCNCRWTGGWCHSQDCPKYDEDQQDPEKMAAFIKGLVIRDLSAVTTVINGYTDAYGNPCTACDKGECHCEKCRACKCADCKEERRNGVK
jgi:hypothetical protein